ncbi:cytochrome C oxidase subunit IV family protein [Compostibacter hankyongensis]|uniref:Cytochrome C oxidase subunit IV n=1 Tax=Compostibacter hankyongensis TaxID=1007089 RepID=A0ABP8FEI2_9BACT
MENTQALEAHAPVQEGKDPVVKRLLRVFWILLIVTIIEVGFAFLHYFTKFPPRALLNAIFIGLTVVKAFYIMGEFMHLRHEVKNLIWTILIPLLLLVWAIVAFLADGNSWKNMKKSQNIEATSSWEQVQHEQH